MPKYSLALLFALALPACSGPEKRATAAVTPAAAAFYSSAVGDTFSIFVSVPEGASADRYPVVYTLDANLYFDIFSTLMKKYSEVGLLPPAIIVGIGYKDFPAMDSLRNRDYTYPAAIPEYGMSVSGGADRFLQFITRELAPHIDASYPTDKNKRVLMGHSLGGYFALYALQQRLAGKDSLLKGFIAASPSAHYNHYYLLQALEQAGSSAGAGVKVYAAFGGLENGEDTTMLPVEKVLQSLRRSLEEKRHTGYKGEVYSGLDHMDTQLPAFVKGLQWVLGEGLNRD